MKHTPGPWGLEESSNGGLLLIRGNHADRMQRHPQTHLQIVPEADARLIAAAPDLLEAAQAYLLAYSNYRAQICTGKDDDEFMVAHDRLSRAEDVLRAAIAKATGET